MTAVLENIWFFNKELKAQGRYCIHKNFGGGNYKVHFGKAHKSPITKHHMWFVDCNVQKADIRINIPFIVL